MSDWKVGDRVRIPAVMSPMRQPNPQHEGKEGTITGTEQVTLGAGSWFDVPVITLDDGAVLMGYQCWWEPVKTGKVN
jgi:hypothetical protein